MVTEKKFKAQKGHFYLIRMGIDTNAYSFPKHFNTHFVNDDVHRIIKRTNIRLPIRLEIHYVRGTKVRCLLIFQTEQTNLYSKWWFWFISRTQDQVYHSSFIEIKSFSKAVDCNSIHQVFGLFRDFFSAVIFFSIYKVQKENISSSNHWNRQTNPFSKAKPQQKNWNNIRSRWTEKKGKVLRFRKEKKEL